MTMPSERTRSIIQTREFLVDLSRDKSLPEAVRTEALRLLRHYPAADEVLLAGKMEEQRGDGLPWVFLSPSIDQGRSEIAPTSVFALPGKPKNEDFLRQSRAISALPTLLLALHGHSVSCCPHHAPLLPSAVVFASSIGSTGQTG